MIIIIIIIIIIIMIHYNIVILPLINTNDNTNNSNVRLTSPKQSLDSLDNSIHVVMSLDYAQMSIISDKTCYSPAC